MKIVLIGYMGSGKSAVGRELGNRLNRKFIDLDNYIESELNTTIAEVFKKKGELYFRRKEHELLKKVLEQNEALVLATGGGTPVYSGNMKLVQEKTPHVFYLKMSIEGLVARLSKEKEHRPLIQHIADDELPEFIGKHLFERNPFYTLANHIIECDNKTVETIAGEIQEFLS